MMIFMGARNTSGLKVQCGNCGYVWFYNGGNAITSCPHCGYRVRISTPQRVNVPASKALITERKREPLI